MTLILGKILDDNCEVINYLEERLQLLSAAYSEQDEHPDPKELLRLRRSLVTAKQAVYPMRRIVSRALRQDPPLVIGSDNAPRTFDDQTGRCRTYLIGRRRITDFSGAALRQCRC